MCPRYVLQHLFIEKLLKIQKPLKLGKNKHRFGTLIISEYFDVF
jgi:hypothetical protein